MPYHPLDPPVSETSLKKILQDPLLLQQVSDRVFELLEADLHQLAERSSGSGRYV
jgi:hypothetical protein